MVQNITSAVPLPTRESVVRATLTELEKMKHSNHERQVSKFRCVAVGRKIHKTMYLYLYFRLKGSRFPCIKALWFEVRRGIDNILQGIVYRMFWFQCLFFSSSKSDVLWDFFNEYVF